MIISDPQQFLNKLDKDDWQKLQSQFARIDRLLGPGDKFKFGCEKRGDCCRDRHEHPIMLSVYDVFKLRRQLKVSGQEFAEKYGKAILGARSELPLMILRNEWLDKKSGQSRCVNLQDNQCSVYKNRPLVCRLYPVGRALDPEINSYFMLTKTDGCCPTGCGKEHTIEEWLKGAEAEPFFEWNDRFHQLYMQIDYEHYKKQRKEIKWVFGNILYDIGSPLEQIVGKEEYARMSKLEDESLLETTHMIAQEYINIVLKKRNQAVT